MESILVITINLKNIALGAAFVGMVVSGSGPAFAQSVAAPAKASSIRCDVTLKTGKNSCAKVARASAPLGDGVSYQSSNARPVGSIVIPAVAAAAAIGLAIALVSSGNGRGPVPVVVSP